MTFFPILRRPNNPPRVGKEVKAEGTISVPLLGQSEKPVTWTQTGQDQDKPVGEVRGSGVRIVDSSGVEHDSSATVKGSFGVLEPTGEITDMVYANAETYPAIKALTEKLKEPPYGSKER